MQVLDRYSNVCICWIS